MITVIFSNDECQKLMALLGTKCLWVEANPFLMKLGEAMQRHQQGGPINNESIIKPQSPDDKDIYGRERGN